MSDSRAAFGLRVHTPFGPRKSGMPDSVEMPAPVSATMRVEADTRRQAAATRSLIAPVYAGRQPSPARASPFSIADRPELEPLRAQLGNQPGDGIDRVPLICERRRLV